VEPVPLLHPVRLAWADAGSADELATWAASLKIELEIGLPIFATADAKEGTRAFKEKREPRYEGA